MAGRVLAVGVCVYEADRQREIINVTGSNHHKFLVGTNKAGRSGSGLIGTQI